MYSYKAYFLLSVMCSLFSCQSQEKTPAQLTVSPTTVTVPAEGGTSEMMIECSDQWDTSVSAFWLHLSQTTGTSGSTTVQLIAMPNASGTTRSTKLSIGSSNGEARQINVSQASLIYPSYNTSPKAPDATGMGSSAVELAAKIRMGWNIGNTMEAPGGETGWGNPVITKDYIKFVKQQGFNAIRIPCAWDWHHVEDIESARIDQEWLSRVKEVVGYCVDNDIYVLLNIHWDGGWLENNCTADKRDSVNAKQKAYWEQIATVMRDFDEHLMLASANEPNVRNSEEAEVLLSYHQTFVDAVRSTGGRNSYRVLVVQGPSTDIEKTYHLMNSLPIDEVKERMMAEIHFYTPYQFCLMFDGDADWGKMFYYWGEGHHSTIEHDRNATWGEEEDVTNLFLKMKTKFVNKGIPVIMGEYGAFRRNDATHVPADLETHNDAVDYWITYVTREAIANGVIPFWWDTGGALDRVNYTVKDQRTLDALVAGGN